MSECCTVLVVSRTAAEWQPSFAELSDERGYRVLQATSAREAYQLADDAHVDIVISDRLIGDDDGVEKLRRYRVAHPAIIRTLVKDESFKSLPPHTFDAAAIYQFIRRPLDPEQIGLVARRELETRELARRRSRGLDQSTAQSVRR